VDKTGINPRMPFVVKCDPLLLPLIPDYLQNRRRDVDRLTEALARKDFAALRKIGHDMAGSGGAYGLPPLSELGKLIEDAALAGDPMRIEMATADLQVFLDMVKMPP
jgi:HPt (histidine-containing phosphotransfer) domain-containing protein